MKKNIECFVLARSDKIGDLKNLLLPVDAKLFVKGVNSYEDTCCIQAAERLNVFNLLNEYGLVLVIIENEVNNISVAGAKAIDLFLSEYYRASTKKNSDVELFQL